VPENENSNSAEATQLLFIVVAVVVELVPRRAVKVEGAHSFGLFPSEA
jgi:hypothetical protein